MARAKVTNVKDPRERTQAQPTLGFGVPATSDPHHFKVLIPKSNTGKVQISEYLGLQAASSDNAVIDRVLLDRPRWTAIRSEVQRAFNARLAAHGLRSSAWKVGENAVDRLLGKELCVLAWAVEQMDTDKIPVAVRNWLALRPEERWWLFGMTAMATGESRTPARAGALPCVMPWVTWRKASYWPRVAAVGSEKNGNLGRPWTCSGTRQYDERAGAAAAEDLPHRSCGSSAVHHCGWMLVV